MKLIAVRRWASNSPRTTDRTRSFFCLRGLTVDPLSRLVKHNFSVFLSRIAKAGFRNHAKKLFSPCVRFTLRLQSSVPSGFVKFNVAIQHKFFKPAVGAGLAVLCGLVLWKLPLGERWV